MTDFGTQASALGDKPFFRYDLQTEAVVEDGQRYVDVTDPDGGSSFRFFEVEYAVACGMDGQRDLEGLVTWAKAELDLKTNTKELSKIVSKLDELSYLSAEAKPEAAVLPAFENTADDVSPFEEITKFSIDRPQAPVTAEIDVELGDSGKSPIEREWSAEPQPSPDVELGNAGFAGSDRSKAPTRNPAIELGHAGNEEDQILEPSTPSSTEPSPGLREENEDALPSKVMSVTANPTVLEDDYDLGITEAVPENIAPLSDISDSIADEADEADGAAAIVLPEKPVKVASEVESEGKAKAKGPRRNSASMVLWVLLLFAVAGGAAYYYWEYVREQPDESTSIRPGSVQPAISKTPPPAAPTGTLALGEPATVEIRAHRAGVVSWVIATDSEVAKGDEVVKLSGFERVEKAIDRHEKSLASYEVQLKGAQKRKTNKVALLESNVARKKLDIRLAGEKRDAYILRAPVAGVVATQTKPRARVGASDVVATIGGKARTIVSFVLPQGVTAGVDEQMLVVSKDNSALMATCVVTEATGNTVTVACPADSELSQGEAVELKIP